MADSVGPVEESDAVVLQRTYSEVKILRDALIRAMHELKVRYGAGWESYRNNSPAVQCWAEILGGMPEGL